MKTINELCDIVRETAYAIHVYHGHGHLEKVYENALAHRLQKAGVDVKQQHPIQVFDEDGTMIGDYVADLATMIGVFMAFIQNPWELPQIPGWRWLEIKEAVDAVT